MTVSPRVRCSLSRSISLSLASAIAVAACGGAPTLPAGGAGKLGEKTFAGQNKCNPKNHERPFVIEWDATDQSSFQSYAASDIVVVKYEGCEMKVLDGCRGGDLKSNGGSYAPPQWTSGGVETIDIHDEGELYAKLPLGAATLSGKVESGEKLHMEYYVSGTRTATRDALFRADLAKNPKCAGATHFVYAYNLGAFALATQSNLKGEVHGSYFGFGAGGSKATETKADKKGGDLAKCKGESAKEVEDCKVPVRLTLREISAGEDPGNAALKGAQSDAALNATGALKAESDAEKKALALFQSALVKMQSGDGKGCLADMDQHDILDPRPGGLTTSPASGKPAGMRAQCVMLTGQCSTGKELLRKALQATKSGEMGPDRIDTVTDATASQWCRGSSVADKDKLAAAANTLTMGGNGVQQKTAAECQEAFDTWMRLRQTADPKPKLDSVSAATVGCFAKAGDCAAAFKAFKQINDAKAPGPEERSPRSTSNHPAHRNAPERVTHGPSPDGGFKGYTDEEVRRAYDGLAGSMAPNCKGK